MPPKGPQTMVETILLWSVKVGVASLRGYITLSDAVLIPAVGGVSQGSAKTVDMVPGG